ncbi:MAG: hypothetical protein WBL61_05415 [Bryobacteraceae bacterium]
MELVRRLAFWGIAGALCFTGGAVAQVTMTLTGVGEGFVMGGVYVSPYVATINGVTTYVICDDFATDVSLGETWQAVDNPLSSVGPGGPQKFTSSDWSPYTIQQEYDAAAILAEDVIANVGNSTLAGEYSYAIWTLFDPAAINGYGGSSLTSAETSAVNSFRTAALTEAASGGGSGLDVSIYTPSPLGASQEYLVVSTPEASLPATLGIELFALVGVIFLMRRRLVRLRA